MAGLDFKFFDCDNHYYEALDAFTRHIEPEYRKRAHAVGRTRRQAAAAGRRQGQPVHPEPDVRPGRPAGRDGRVLPRAQPESADMPRALRRAGARSAPAYRDRDARLAVMDEQGMEGAIMLPTLGVGMETAAAPRPRPRSRRRSARSTGGWKRTGASRTRTASSRPRTSRCADPKNAVDELEWALERDARFVVMIPGPITTARERVARRSRCSTSSGHWPTIPASLYLPLRRDLLREVHAGVGRAGLHRCRSGELGFRTLFSGNALQDTFANLLDAGHFHRFPNIRMASIESGSDWVFHLFEKLTKVIRPDPAHLSGGSAGGVPPPRVGVAVLRGRARQPAAFDGRRAHHHGLRLPARRRDWPIRPPTSRTWRTSTTHPTSAER